MTLLRVCREGAPTRYFIDGRRVTRDRYDHVLHLARMAGRSPSALWTRITTSRAMMITRHGASLSAVPGMRESRAQ